MAICLHAPAVASLTEGGRFELKCRLLAACDLPQGKTFWLKSTYSRTRELHDALRWMRVWQLTDEELYFAQDAVGQDSSLGAREVPLFSPNESSERLALLRIKSEIKKARVSPRNKIVRRTEEGSGRRFVSSTSAFDFSRGTPTTRSADSTLHHASSPDRMNIVACKFSSENSNNGCDSESASGEDIELWLHNLQNMIDALVSKTPFLELRCADEPRNSNLIQEDKAANEALIALATQCNMTLHPAVAIAANAPSSGGRGVVSTSQISSGETILEIPESAILNVYSALSSPLFGPIAIELLRCLPRYLAEPRELPKTQPKNDLYRRFFTDPDAIVLMIFLLFERSLGNKSHYEQYFHLVPTVDEAGDADDLVLAVNGNLSLAPPEVIEFLDHEACQTMCRLSTQALFDLFCWLKADIVPKFPDELNSSVLSWDGLLWARWMLESRSFALKIWPPPPCAPQFPRAEPAPLRLSSEQYSNFRVLHFEFVKEETHPDAQTDDEDEDNEDKEEVPFLPGISVLAHHGRDIRKRICMTYNGAGGINTARSKDEKHEFEFTVGDRVTCLLPVADLFNHSWTAQLAVSSSGALDADRLASGRRVVRFEAQGTILSAGVELCVNYGPMQSWEVFQYYGFCPPLLSPFDTVNLRFDLCEEDPLFALKHIIMQHRGIANEHIIRAPCGDIPGFAVGQLLDCVCINTASSAIVGFSGADAELRLSCFKSLSSLLEDLAEPHRQRCRELDEFDALPPYERPHWYDGWHRRLSIFHSHQVELFTSNLAKLRAICVDS